MSEGSRVSQASSQRAALGSEPYDPANLLDRLSDPATLQRHYRRLEAREATIVRARLASTGGRVLSVGAGWHPGRHLFPAPAYELTAVDADPARVAAVLERGTADAGVPGLAGRLDFAPASFDVVLYRLVLHHVVFHEPLDGVFAEAARLLVPGGALVAIEPGLWHPVGAGLALANRLGFAVAVHGTPDDVPLSPRRLIDAARAAGLTPELHAVTYTWRRLPPAWQQTIGRLDDGGSRPRAARLGHTLMLIARKPGPVAR